MGRGKGDIFIPGGCYSRHGRSGRMGYNDCCHGGRVSLPWEVVWACQAGGRGSGGSLLN